MLLLIISTWLWVTVVTATPLPLMTTPCVQSTPSSLPSPSPCITERRCPTYPIRPTNIPSHVACSPVLVSTTFDPSSNSLKAVWTIDHQCEIVLDAFHATLELRILNMELLVALDKDCHTVTMVPQPPLQSTTLTSPVTTSSHLSGTDGVQSTVGVQATVQQTTTAGSQTTAGPQTTAVPQTITLQTVEATGPQTSEEGFSDHLYSPGRPGPVPNYTTTFTGLKSNAQYYLELSALTRVQETQSGSVVEQALTDDTSLVGEQTGVMITTPSSDPLTKTENALWAASDLTVTLLYTDTESTERNSSDINSDSSQQSEETVTRRELNANTSMRVTFTAAPCNLELNNYNVSIYYRCTIHHEWPTVISMATLVVTAAPCGIPLTREIPFDNSYHAPGFGVYEVYVKPWMIPSGEEQMGSTNPPQTMTSQTTSPPQTMTSQTTNPPQTMTSQTQSDSHETTGSSESSNTAATESSTSHESTSTSGTVDSVADGVLSGLPGSIVDSTTDGIAVSDPNGTPCECLLNGKCRYCTITMRSPTRG